MAVRRRALREGCPGASMRVPCHVESPPHFADPQRPSCEARIRRDDHVRMRSRRKYFYLSREKSRGNVNVSRHAERRGGIAGAPSGRRVGDVAALRPRRRVAHVPSIGKQRKCATAARRHVGNHAMSRHAKAHASSRKCSIYRRAIGEYAFDLTCSPFKMA